MAKKRIHPKKSRKAIQVRVKGLSADVAKVEAPAVRTDLPEFGPGDTIRVAVKIKEGEKERIQNYEGVVIGRSNRGINRSFIVRKISHGVGVERIFLESSPRVAKIDVVQKGKVRRAKLYYVRDLEGRAAKIDREIETVSGSGAEAKK